MTRPLAARIALASSALAVAALVAAGFAAGPAEARPAPGDRVFEMRTYYANEGKGPALHQRFREHTCDLFRKHGMDPIGFWAPIEAKDGRDDKLVYILAYPSKAAAEASWKAFQADPEWIKARDASEVDGKLIKKIESVYLNPTDYSTIK